MSGISQTDVLSVSGTAPYFTTTNPEQIGRQCPDGTSLSNTGDLVSVYGVTPTAQAATIAAVATTGATSELAGVETAVNSILVALKNFGIIAAS